MVITSIFFKTPIPGTVKTRLASGVGDDAAAKLATAFFLDTLDVVSSTPGLEPVVATTGALPSELEDQIHCPIWQQGPGALSERLERILGRGLQEGARAMALGADSPGITSEMLIKLRNILESKDAAIGPTEDGGYYALGLNRFPRGLLQNVSWSSAETRRDTESRLAAHGLTFERGDLYFDVDHPSDLTRLAQALDSRTLRAPQTLHQLKSMQLVLE